MKSLIRRSPRRESCPPPPPPAESAIRASSSSSPLKNKNKIVVALLGSEAKAKCAYRVFPYANMLSSASPSWMTSSIPAWCLNPPSGCPETLPLVIPWRAAMGQNYNILFTFSLCSVLGKSHLGAIRDFEIWAFKVFCLWTRKAALRMASTR